MRAGPGSGEGFTVLELMTAVAVGALLVSIAVPLYRERIERLRVHQAEQELAGIAIAIESFRTANNFQLPQSLDEVHGIPAADPWGNPYAYLDFAADIPGIKSKIRKDHNLHPLNSEFDLYSLGADGDSRPALTSRASQDDVIWARDGSFIGLASDF